jgi:hypothetical protein
MYFWILVTYKDWESAHNYDDYNKETLKTKWVKNESQH